MHRWGIPHISENKEDVSWTLFSENGGTHATIQITGEMSGFFKLGEGMIARQLEQSLDEQFELLKGLVEA